MSICSDFPSSVYYVISVKKRSYGYKKKLHNHHNASRCCIVFCLNMCFCIDPFVKQPSYIVLFGAGVEIYWTEPLWKPVTCCKPISNGNSSQVENVSLLTAAVDLFKSAFTPANKTLIRPSLSQLHKSSKQKSVRLKHWSIMKMVQKQSMTRRVPKVWLFISDHDHITLVKNKNAMFSCVVNVTLLQF